VESLSGGRLAYGAKILWVGVHEEKSRREEEVLMQQRGSNVSIVLGETMEWEKMQVEADFRSSAGREKE